MFFPDGPKRRDYTPPLDKRFAVSGDSLTHERITWLREYQKELTKRFGFHIGLGVFGSLIKGKELTEVNKARTDIDVHISFLIPSMEDVLKRFSPREWMYHRPSAEELSDLERSHYFGIFKDFVWGNVQQEPHPFPLQTMIHGYIDTEDHFRRITRALFDDDPDPPTAPLNTWTDFESAFSVDVGESLRPIRQRIIYSLRHYLSDEERNEAWKTILDEIIASDLRSREVLEPLLPETFDIAETIYGSAKPGTPLKGGR